jgi:lipooligosaccharide transport system permease protein
VEREARLWLRDWQAPLLNGVVLPWLLLVALGLGLGGTVDAHSGGVNGLRYVVYVAPGILAGGIVRNAAGAAMWPVLSGVAWTRSFHSAVATPLAPTSVFAGVLTWIGIRSAVIALGFVGVAALLGAVPSLWGLLAVPAAVGGALAVAAPVAAFAATRGSDQSFELLERLAIMPMFLFAGTFFPVNELPAAVRPLAWTTPLWHAVELCRGATTATLVPAAGMAHLAVLLAWTSAGIWWGRRTFTRRLTA